MIIAFWQEFSKSWQSLESLASMVIYHEKSTEWLLVNLDWLTRVHPTMRLTRMMIVEELRLRGVDVSKRNVVSFSREEKRWPRKRSEPLPDVPPL